MSVDLSGKNWLIVGFGRVGRALAGVLRNGGFSVTVATRGADSAARAVASGLPASHVGVAAVAPEVDVVVFCVPDDSLPRVASVTMAAAPLRSDRVWLHTSGVYPASVLGARGEVGACHPLMAFSGDESDISGLVGSFFAVDGTPLAQARAQQIVELAGGQSGVVGADARVAYHAAAVLASNGVYGLIEAARALTAAADIDNPVLLQGLVRLCAQSASNCTRSGHVGAATGPVIRGDAATVRQHRQRVHALDHDLGALYDSLARSLLHVAEARRLPERQLAALRAVIEAPVELKQSRTGE